MNALTVLGISSAVASALVGGVFFAFSTFVMRALAGMESSQGVLAMQRINLAVINPWFLGVFLGTVLYLVGSAGVTMAFNVPRNNRLAALEPASTEAATYWPAYAREWLWWNHVRCATSLLAAVAAALAVAR